MRTLPLTFTGRSVRNSNLVGTLYAASRRRQCAKLFGVGLPVPGCHHDHGADRFAPFFVVQPDDGDIAHPRIVGQDGFDLDRVHVLAPADDHVVLPAGQVEIALAVGPCHVAGAEPSTPEGGLTLDRLAEVAAHDGIAPGGDFPHLAGNDLAQRVVDEAEHDAEGRSSDRRQKVRVARQRTTMIFRRQDGLPSGFGAGGKRLDEVAVENVERPPQQHRGDRAAAVDDGLQG